MSATLSALIVDDEPLARALVREFLRSHPDVRVLGECDNGQDAVRDIEALQPDVVFLDIQMPGLGGLEVLECCGRRHGVVFTTAYEQYAIKAFELHAVDYLLKPFSQARFDAALLRARQIHAAGHHGATPVQALVRSETARLQRVLVRDRQQVHVLPLPEIEFAQAQDDYVSLRCAGRDYLKTQTLAELAEELDAAQFVRVHRSYLLNVAHLQALERPAKDSIVARTRSGASVPVSRSGHERLLQAMQVRSGSDG